MTKRKKPNTSYKCLKCLDKNLVIACGCNECEEIIFLRDKGGRVKRYKNHHHKRNSKKILYTDGGYEMVKRPDHPFCDYKGRVKIHRLVMERYIGRYLKPEEVVHHIDGNTHNNKIDNLMLFNSNSEHIIYENDGIPIHLRKCSNPKCPDPYKTYISKSGWIIWYRDGKGGYLCAKRGCRKLKPKSIRE